MFQTVMLIVIAALLVGCEDGFSRERDAQQLTQLSEKLSALTDRVDSLERKLSEQLSQSNEVSRRPDTGRAALASPTTAAPAADDAPISEVQFRLDGTEVDDPFIGAVDAPITMFLFSGLECEKCREFFREVYPELRTRFVDTGKLKIVLRDFPLPQHKRGTIAAQAAHCVGENGGYWAFYEGLLAPQALDGDLLPTSLPQAERTRIERCVKIGKYVGEISEDRASGAKMGVVGIPTAFLGVGDKAFSGVKIRGKQPLKVYEIEIQKLLNNADAKS